MTAAKRKDMTEGNILKTILLFALPILIGNIFQQFYNIADTAIIGHLLGDNALASVGASAPIYNLVISFANGMTNGFSVVISRYFGANDEHRLQKAISLSYILTAGVSLILTVVSLLGISPLLRFLNTPAEIFPDAESYLRVILAFAAVTMFYNMFAGMFRAVGNSLIPLIFLVISTLINIPLDFLFVGTLGKGVAGAGIATVISQFISVILCIFFINYKYSFLKFRIKSASFDKELLSDLSLTGISMALMLAVVSIGSVALQNAVNSFGSQTITAHTAARKFDDIFMLPLATISISTSTFASQNYGAENFPRVRKGIITGIKIAFVWSAFSIVCAMLFSGFVVKAFTGTSNDLIVSTAIRYIRINVVFFPVLSVLLILRSALQGVGHKAVPLLGSVIELAAKFAAAFFIAPILGYIGICWLEPVIWVICSVTVGFDFLRFLKNIDNSPENSLATEG